MANSMWIFTVKQQSSGCAYSGVTIFRCIAGERNGNYALKKLYSNLLSRDYFSSDVSEEEFLASFGEDWSAYIHGVEIYTVHPNDDTFMR